MTYRVLSLKYRPQVFSDLIGQDHVVLTLKNALLKDRVAHAYLFSGARGVGKTTTARLLAKALNCPQFENGEPCNKCQVCAEITRGNNLDVLEIDGASNRGIDEIRELREAVKYPPTVGKYRIYIIDEVHMLTTQAFNALLKTLEEPPEHIKFFLATTDPQKVPATILSRTQRFDFKRIPTPDLANYLERILGEEGIDFEESALHALARKADGSVRDSLSLLDQVIAYQSEKIDEAAVATVLGLIDDSFFAGLLDGIARHDSRGVLAQVEALFDGGYDIREVCQGFNQYLRDAILSLETGDAKLTSKGVLVPVPGDLQVADLITLMQLGLETEGRLRYAQQPRILIEHQLLKMAGHDRVVSIQEVLHGLKDRSGKHDSPSPKPAQPRPPAPVQTAAAPGTESRLQSSATVSDPPPEQPPPAPGAPQRTFSRGPEPSVMDDSDAEGDSTGGVTSSLPPEDALPQLKQRWEEIVTAVEVRSRQLGAMLPEVELAEISGGNLIMHLPASQSLQLKIFTDKRNLIEEAIRGAFGWQVAVLPTIPETRGSETPGTQARNAQSEVFNELIETFKGEEY